VAERAGCYNGLAMEMTVHRERSSASGARDLAVIRTRHGPSSPVGLDSAAAAFLCGTALLLSGCVSTRYLEARKGTPPPEIINVPFQPSLLEASLNAVVTYNGPGSWKRDAFWDEYVVTVRNTGDQPITVTRGDLADFAGAVQHAGDNPWALEKESKTLEEKYRGAGVAFVRYTTPGLIIVGTGAAVVAANAFTAAGAVAATATLVVLPVYYIGVVTINHYNKAAMDKEFERRRIVLPLTLAPGKTWTGSLFFPMVPSPRSLSVKWSSGAKDGESVLPLDFLHSLHIKPSPPPGTVK
jgi:hypothetical protein